MLLQQNLPKVMIILEEPGTLKCCKCIFFSLPTQLVYQVLHFHSNTNVLNETVCMKGG